MGPEPAGDLGLMGRGAGGKNKGRESVGGDRTESRELLGHPFKRVNDRVVGRGEVPVGVTNYQRIWVGGGAGSNLNRRAVFLIDGVSIENLDGADHFLPEELKKRGGGEARGGGKAAEGDAMNPHRILVLNFLVWDRPGPKINRVRSQKCPPEKM